MVGKRGIDPRMVKIPGTLVDALVLAPDQKQTYQIDYDPALCGEAREGDLSMGRLSLDERKVIVKRAALELRPNARGESRIWYALRRRDDRRRRAGFEDQITLSIETGQLGRHSRGRTRFRCDVLPDGNFGSALPVRFVSGRRHRHLHSSHTLKWMDTAT